MYSNTISRDIIRGGPATTKKLRVWPAVVMVALFWTFLYVNYNADFSMFSRFISRMVAYGVLLLAFMGWWLTRSAISWRNRLLAIVVVIAVYVLAWFVADKSMNAFGLFLAAFPIVISVWTAWLWIARSADPFVQRVGFCAAMLLAFSYFTLVRFDGLDATQRAETSWRWTPTNEQAFLIGHIANAKEQPNDTVASAKPWTPRPGDWLEYRGPYRDGVIVGSKLATDWKQHPPKLLWRKRVGPGWSGMIVVDGHLVTQEQRGKLEVVTCYDAATGDEIWVHQDPVRFEESLSGAGPRGTPTYANGRIYSFGAKGKLNCLKAETGEVIWSHDCAVDAEVAPADMPQWGYAVSPLVVDGLVIVFAGGASDKSVLAYHADDGKLAWTHAGGKQSYSSPQLVTLHGQKQILMHDTSGLYALNIPDGAFLWKFPNASEMSLPMLQPHAAENDTVVLSTEPGAALLDITRDGDKWSADADWTTNRLRAGFNDFVLHSGCLFGFDDGVFCCIDLTDGKRLWKKGRLGHDQILFLADQNLFLLSSEKGEVILVSADRKGYEELGRFQAIEGKTWNGPVLADGRLFLRNGEEMAVFDVTDNSSAAGNDGASL